MAKDLSYYMNLPYNMIMERAEDGGWMGYLLELKGCTAEADSREELLRELDHAKLNWIEDALDEERYIPEPLKSEGYSGKFNLRIPKSLHQKLAIAARQEGVSLNQMALYLISNGLSGK
ncbi:MAG: type II toxin-antitoxin system HicB family antitoxin [Selenomonadales bacterium]|nr:type II toxin-antitoxin system HicB family antitoxin [Selenomonadales bacterium]MDY3740870.1 toxin-antitoxin system HicB family antitoxin [Selenomonadaceae bacterium]